MPKPCTTCGHGTPVQAPQKSSRKAKTTAKPNPHVTALAKSALARVRKKADR